jgi:alginate O-acetyltransferase complex protein AlgI
MALNSSLYLVSLVVAITTFWLLPGSARRAFVLLASLAFYATWGIVFVWLPLFVAFIVYICGRQIQANASKAKPWMSLGIGCVLAFLIVFKYRGFLLSSFVFLHTLPSPHASLLTSVAFPLGISFYTFEAIGYLIDVRQGRVKMPAFLDLCLFFLFWPNILAGPILRARELVPQLGFREPFETQFVFDGLDRLIWGLVQKTAIANVLGTWVDRGFAPTATGAPPTLDSWFLAIAFALQIYFDFAGYTNMAIGTARLLGVTLPENFRHPYYAATPPDFWSRWHMTLSRWIRDYLFFPITAKWGGAPVPFYLSLIGVMAVVGLWHGAGWNFVLWGVMHGAYLVLYRVYEKWRGATRGASESRVLSALWRIATLIAVLAAWVVFRSIDLARATTVLASMFFRFSTGATYGMVFYFFTLAIMLLCALEPRISQSLSQAEERAADEGVSPFRVVVRPLAYLFGLFVFLLFDTNNAQFIYSQF